MSANQAERPLVDRRSVIRGAVAAAGLAAVPGLAACGKDSGSKSDKGPVSFGSNYSDEVPKRAMAQTLERASDEADVEVKVNTIDHKSFQENINQYLQGTPDDVYAWFSGYRMRFFAAKGLAMPIDDVWAKVGADFSEALAGASTGDDGKKYLIPFASYPWAVFYRKSVFEQRGYEIPETLDELKALGQRMSKDGLVPLSFADKDGWPAMGTFDILNMRVNGYQYHVDLMAGKEGWDSAKTRQVFQTWAELLPLHAPGALGRTWQEGAQMLQQKKAGMYMFGMFVSEQFPANEIDDLDFFTFPEINPEFGRDALDAPVDGFMLSAKAKRPAEGKKLLRGLASAAAQEAFIKANPGYIAVVSNADTSGYSTLQKKAVEVIGAAKHVAQYLDRDTRPDFASTVVIPSIQAFIRDPKDITGLTTKMEQQKKAIFASE